MDETYEGWKNRETWAANLWMENTQEVYGYVVKEVGKILSTKGDVNTYSGSTKGRAEYFFKTFFESLKERVDTGKAKPSTIKALSDIGSIWRVHYGELADHWITKLREL